jgi:hypothetical protein
MTTKSFPRSLLLAVPLAAAPSAPALAAESLLFAASAYAARSDRPFHSLSFSYFHLDDFEGVARTPGYAATTGGQILPPGALTDSVDADDGALDGSGTGGSSWFSAGATDTFTFSFDAGVLGALPTHAGIVWTDVGTPSPPGGVFGMAGIFFEAFDSGGALIGGVGAPNLGDGAVDGATAEDRFFGAYHPGGISSIRITATSSNDWEVDHLQYGLANPIPEPQQWLLMGLGIGALVWRLRGRSGRGSRTA